MRAKIFQTQNVSDPKGTSMKVIFGGIKRPRGFLNCLAQRLYLNWSLTLKTKSCLLCLLISSSIHRPVFCLFLLQYYLACHPKLLEQITASHHHPLPGSHWINGGKFEILIKTIVLQGASGKPTQVQSNTKYKWS